MNLTPSTPPRSQGFTLMEILVVIAIILVLAAIAFPVYKTVQTRANKAIALQNMKNLGSAAGNYVSQNDGTFPPEDADGADNWNTAAKPENSKVWYNSLPTILGQKGVGQYASNPQAFYSKENLLYLPGAKYPETDRKLAMPIFAIAMNTKLHRNDPKNPSAGKAPVRFVQITNPSRTVLFLEQGISGEEKAMAQQSKKDYDGSPKGSAKSFVARYNGIGVIVFVDGHAEFIDGDGILEQNGAFKYPLDQGDIMWGKSPDEDPNK